MDRTDRTKPDAKRNEADTKVAAEAIRERRRGRNRRGPGAREVEAERASRARRRMRHRRLALDAPLASAADACAGGGEGGEAESIGSPRCVISRVIPFRPRLRPRKTPIRLHTGRRFCVVRSSLRPEPGTCTWFNRTNLWLTDLRNHNYNLQVVTVHRHPLHIRDDMSVCHDVSRARSHIHRGGVPCTYVWSYLDVDVPGLVAGREREGGLRRAVGVGDGDDVLPEESAEAVGAVRVGRAGGLPRLPLLQEAVDDVSDGEVVEVPVGEAHLVASVGVQRRPQHDAGDGRVGVRLPEHLLQVDGLRLRVVPVADVDLGEPDGQAERGELVEHGAHERDVGLEEVSLQADALQDGAPRAEVLELRHVRVHGGGHVVAGLDHVELVHEERGERVGVLRHAEELHRRVGAQPLLVEVVVQHLVVHVPVRELAAVAGHQVLDPAVDGGAEVVR